MSGRVPFDGETTVSIAIQHLQEEMTAPSVYAPELPISLEKIIIKCTQKSPDRRYHNVSELLVDLKQVLVHPNEDFVTISDGIQSKTKMIEPNEVKKIKSARAARQEEVRPKEPEIEEEDDEEEEDGFLNPKLEKAITIGGIVAALIIIVLIIYFVGNVFGLFKGAPDKVKDNDTETSEPSVINTEKEKTEQVKMVNVKGLTVAEARTELSKIGLGLYEQGTQASEQYEKGQIMSQDVEEGTEVDIHTTINVYVSTGAGEIKIPNIVGYDSEAAMNMLTDQGFVPNRKYEYSDTAASGKVISQDPAGDTAAKKGDTVTLVVSQGKEAEAKKNSEALNYGSFRSVVLTNKQCIFERKSENERVLVAINADSESYTAHFDAGCGMAVDLISGEKHDFGGGSELPPYSAYFWKMEH